MALVKKYQSGPAIIEVYDDCYKGKTREDGAKILEEALNETPMAQNGYFTVTDIRGKKDKKEQAPSERQVDI